MEIVLDDDFFELAFHDEFFIDMRTSESAAKCIRIISNFSISNVEGKRGLAWLKKDMILSICVFT